MGSFLDKIAKRLAVAKGSETLDGKTMTGEQPNKVVINPDIVRHNESFKSFLDILIEAKKNDSEKKEQNKEGVLHEVLVHKHLVEKHGAVAREFDDGRENAEDAHKRIATDLYGKNYEKNPEYKDASKKAEGAADEIKNEEGNRWKKGKTQVAWTSKHGDVQKLTGTPATQKGDSSDLYIHHPHLSGDDKFGGYSLKKTDKKNEDPPVSNGGRADVDKTLGTSTDEHVNSAKEKMFKQFPHLRGKSTEDIKAEVKSNPEIKEAESKTRDEMLKNISSSWSKGFENMDHDKKVSVLREAMRANPTGYRHARVISGGTNGDFTHKTVHPVTQHDEYLNDPKNVRTEVNGNSVRFYHQHPTTGEKTPLLQIRAKSAGSAGIFGSTKTSGEHYKLKKDKSVGRILNTNDPIQVEAKHETAPEPKTTAASKKTKKTEAPASEPERHHTLFWGRVNPPTAGHEQAYNVVRKVARQNGGTSSIVLSRSTDPKKNPLTPEQKEKHAKRAFPKVNTSVADPQHPTLLHQLSKLHEQGVTNLHMVAGSDRHPEYRKLINQYNGVKGNHGYYNFKKVELHSAGERDPDEEGTAGISASSQRAHATNGRQKEFAAASPSTMKPAHVKELYNDVRTGLSTPAPKKLKNVVKTKIAKAS
jgi:hypothetical protein